MELSWWQAAALGVVQGLTEFLPISSTAHLRIFPALAGWDDPGAAFSAVIQLGTLAAVLVYFAPDIHRLTRAALRSLWSAEARGEPDARLAWAIAAGNVPIVVAGLALRDWIETEARSLYLVAAMLILVGLLLALAERVARHEGEMAALRLWQVVVIGVFQALALIPGTSRSGATILGGLLLGLRREQAARFSFLLGIPAILGSGLLQLPPLLRAAPGDGWMPLALGLLTALVSGYVAIGFLLAYLRTHSTHAFVAYRLALGALVLALAWEGAIR
jgi:undecaprenyl-diphosphatase